MTNDMLSVITKSCNSKFCYNPILTVTEEKTNLNFSIILFPPGISLINAASNAGFMNRSRVWIMRCHSQVR